jgi:uncharacterized protein YifE (UPF0438 family)
MCGTDLKDSELVNLAQMVLLGKKKFVGDTRSDTFGMVDDDIDIYKKYPYGLARFIDKDDLLHIFSTNVKNLEWGERRVEVSALNQDTYGWLRPDGTWYSVGFGDHNGWAFRWCDENGHEDTLRKFFKDKGRDFEDVVSKAGDYLVHVGWVLLHSPSYGAAEMTYNDAKPLTKKQLDFLFTYASTRKMYGIMSTIDKMWENR